MLLVVSSPWDDLICRVGTWNDAVRTVNEYFCRRRSRACRLLHFRHSVTPRGCKVKPLFYANEAVALSALTFISELRLLTKLVSGHGSIILPNLRIRPTGFYCTEKVTFVSRSGFVSLRRCLKKSDADCSWETFIFWFQKKKITYPESDICFLFLLRFASLLHGGVRRRSPL